MVYAPRLSLLAAACAGVLMAPAASLAQDAPVAATQGESLQEIVITSQRRTERLQAAPVSVTALSNEGLEALNITSVANLQVAVPNLLIGNPLGQGVILAYIRGIGTANPVFSQDPAVGIYLDDVYLTRAIGANMDLFDIERVEVLRGPQGTLWGANSPAGAIRIVTAKPDLSEGFAVRGQAIFGSFNERGLNLAASLPIVDRRVAARLVVQSGSRDGVQTNLADGSKSGTRDFTSLRLHLLAKLNERWDLLLSANDFDNKAVPLSGVNFAAADGSDLFLTPGFNKRDFFSELKVRYDNIQSRGLTADLTGRLGWAEFRSITAHRKLAFQGRFDGDAKTAALFDNSQFLDNEQLTQEFNLAGKRGPLSWLAGAYMINEKTNFAWHVRILGSVVNPPLGLNPNFEVNDQTKNGWSLFTQQSLDVSDRLTLTGGLRWTEETKDWHIVGYAPTAVADYGLPPGTPIPGFDIRQKKTWSAAQWRLAADYKLSADALAFASASRGYRSGGFNGGARSIAEAAAQPFNPEFVTTYEIGMKTEWLARRLRLNATLFSNDYKDQQVAFLNTGAQFGTTTMNSRMHGLELETVWLPTAGLRLFANAGTLRGSSDSATTALVPDPKYQYALGFEYMAQAGAGVSWFAGSTYSYVTAYDIAPNRDPLRRVPAHGELGARIGLNSDDGKWRLELVGANLTNEYWPAFSFNIPRLFTARTPNQPRTFALKLSLNL